MYHLDEYLRTLPRYLAGHLLLSLVAIVAAIVVSVPLGFLISRKPRWSRGVLGVASVIQTIPALALLAMMVPILAWGNTISERFGVHLPSFGFLPASIALIAYSILPILQNTVTGLLGIDRTVMEAAAGVGMTRRQQMLMVELPLASPTIVAGVRTATVWVVGMATIATAVGADGLGSYIFTGLQTRSTSAIVFGCVAAAITALTLDALIRLIEVGIRRRRAWLWQTAVLMIVVLVVVAITAFSGLRDGGSKKRELIRVGAKTFTESYILSEMLAGQVRAKTTLRVETVKSLGSTIAFDALVNGDIDAYVDYSGTIWKMVLKRNDLPESRQKLNDAIAIVLRKKYGVVSLGNVGFENSYALVLRRSQAQRMQVSTLSGLSKVASSLTIGADYEFFQRPIWESLKRTYGFSFGRQIVMDPSLMYQAVKRGAADVVTAYTTDGRIDAFDLVAMEDDAGAVPPYDALILVRQHTLQTHPQLNWVFDELLDSVSTGDMRRMNFEVDQGRMTPRQAAKQLLRALP